MELAVDVPRLVVDGVVVRLDRLPALLRDLVEKVADFVCVARVPDVPEGARTLTLLTHALPGQHARVSIVDRLQRS